MVRTVGFFLALYVIVLSGSYIVLGLAIHCVWS